MGNRILLVGLCLLLAASSLLGQESVWAKRANAAIREAKIYISYTPPNYDKALQALERAYLQDSLNPELHYWLGRCYLYAHEGYSYQKALYYLKKAELTVPNELLPECYYHLGTAFHLHYAWDLAITCFKSALQEVSESDQEFRDAIQKKISECENGKRLEGTRMHVKVENMGIAVNSRYTDYGAVINSDETVMYFTSRRPGATGKKQDALGYFEDIYMTRLEDGRWLPAENVRELNTVYHDAAVSISGNGKYMILYREGDLYESVFDEKKQQWSSPKRMPSPINSRYPETTASLSFNGSLIYFVSQRPKGSFGGLDIFMSRRTTDGGWTEAVNLGATINTPYDERAVVMMPDGQTMYFSSKGHQTMGGFDVFRATMRDGLWSAPENLGFPINTPDHDVYLTVSANQRHAYYAKIAAEGFGGKDIYKITFLDAEPDNFMASMAEQAWMPSKAIKEVPNEMPQKVLRGRLIDKETRKPIAGTMKVWIDTALFKEWELDEWKAQKFTLILPSKAEIKLQFRAPGYQPLQKVMQLEGGIDNELLQEAFALQPNPEAALQVSMAHLYSEGKPDMARTKIQADGDWKIVKGRIFDSHTQLPLQASVRIFASNGKLASEQKTDKFGRFLMAVPKKAGYKMIVASPKHLSKSVSLSAEEALENEYLPLTPLAQGETIVMSHIYFRDGTDELKEESFDELNQILTLLEENPGLYLEIRGHTGDGAHPQAMLRLSNLRAMKIRLYLINNGISSRRLSAKGLGSSEPLVQEDTQEAKMLNQRVEFKIVRVQ